MAKFASAFREIVVPDLQRLLEASAPCVALCVCHFDEVVKETMAAAHRRGATYLHHNIQSDLEDWVLETLFTAITAYEDEYPDACMNARDRWLS